MIEVKDLRKSYRHKEVLAGVSFSLAPGVTGMLGPNGAGKTTTLRCMLGIVKPSAGAVSFSGEIDGLRPRVGYLPQKFGLLKELTVGEALEYFAVLKRIPKAEIRDEIDTSLEEVNLLDTRDHRVGTLSGGMMRRVGIAQALLGSPLVLIFDEPTAGLDPEERARFKRLAANLGRTRAVLISTHIVEDIEAIGSHLIVLHRGRVIAAGTPQNIADAAMGRCFHVPEHLVDERSRVHYVVRHVGSDVPPLVRVLSASPEINWTSVPPSLEDGYLCLTQGVL